MAAAVIDIDKLLDIDPSNGEPVIRGTRLRVLTVAARHLEGRPPEQIAADYPNLSVAAVHAALAFYYDHRPEMDAQEDRETRASHEFASSIGAETL